jgi:rifampicin phosphotransferase
MTAISSITQPLAGAKRRYTRPLTDVSDASLVGGKAEALGRAMRGGLRVPTGFVLITQALDDHLDHNALRDRIAELSSRIDVHDPATVAECSREIRALVTSASMSISQRDELFSCAEVLLACGAVVVRSSAVGEDSRGESFAGQLDSILHVTSPAALERAVLDCWASFWSERAVFYRAVRGAASAGMGVVVQHQVDARAAGVLFTDVGDGSMLAEYAAGLADALVNGSIDPGRVSIDRDTRAFRRTAKSDSGADVAIDAATVDALAETGMRLERVFGAPQDVEWVLDNAGEVWVVQSRPITAPIVASREPARDLACEKNDKRVSWSNANVNENFPGPISPLLYSIAAPGYSQYFRNLARAFGISASRIRAMEPAFRQIIGVHGARMYYNLTSIHSVLRLAPFGKALATSFDTFVGADGGDVQAATLDRQSKLREIGEVAVIAAKTAWQYRSLEKRIARFEATVNAFAERTQPDRLRTMGSSELRDALRDFMDIRLNRWLDASLADAASMVCYGALQRVLQNAYGRDAAVHTVLLKAIPNVISGDPVHQLWELSRMIRRDPSLLALFESTSAGVLDALSANPDFQEFQRAFARYLDDWGFRCSEELMLTSPSFQESPAPLIDMLRAYARLDAASPAEALRAQAAARIAETERVTTDLRGRTLWRGVPGLTYTRALRVLLPWTHASIRFRERARMRQALLYNRCRRIALEIGERLVRNASITNRDDVFFLTVTEIDELLSGAAMFPHQLRELARIRRAAHNKLAATTPPDSFTLAEGEYLDSETSELAWRADVERESGESLRGTSACGGCVTGRATVLRDVMEASRLARGDVLVTRQTDPGWGPVFFLISGLVIERGGMLSHGAIIAREFGIPCVVGVRAAMKTIPDGVTITVDGDSGTVHVGD